MITTIIIDAQKKERDRITAILEAAGKDIKILAQGKDGYDALKLTGSLKPDIAIMDNHLEFIEGEDIPPLLRARSPSTAVVILTSKISDNQLSRAVSNEVSGFVHREADMENLLWILKCISDGGCFISPCFAARILRLMIAIEKKCADLSSSSLKLQAKTMKKQESEEKILFGNSRRVNTNGITSLHTSGEARFIPGDDPTNYLSKTELQIITSVGKGFTSQEIARDMGLAVGTIRNYISSVMHKTGMRNRSQMASYVFYYGLAPLAKPSSVQ